MNEFTVGQRVIVYTTRGWIGGEIHEIHAMTGMITVRIDAIIKGNSRLYPRESRGIWPWGFKGVTVSPQYVRESQFKSDEVKQ